MNDAKHSCGLDIAASCAACEQKTTVPASARRDIIPDLGAFVDWVWALKAERDQLKAENEALRKTMSECISSLAGEMAQKFAGQRPEDMHPVTRRDYDRDMAELAGYRAVMAKDADVTDQRDNENLTRQEVE
ncbi:hypothetical protein ACNFCI_15330 [Pseudomonas sp. NY15356]|uniref:hypothetical protein n=1 Tax=Pseudomonas sp. NY15356 TaxID=3400352 RepID=UPI003A8C6A38